MWKLKTQFKNESVHWRSVNEACGCVAKSKWSARFRCVPSSNQFHSSPNIFVVDAVCLHTIIGRGFSLSRLSVIIISFVFFFNLDLFSIVNTDTFSMFEQRNVYYIALGRCCGFTVSGVGCRLSAVGLALFVNWFFWYLSSALLFFCGQTFDNNKILLDEHMRKYTCEVENFIS